MPYATGKALFFRTLVVLGQDWPVVRVGTLADNLAGALPWAQTTQVCQPLLGNQDIKIMLRMVNVGCKRDNAANATWMGYKN